LLLSRFWPEWRSAPQSWLIHAGQAAETEAVSGHAQLKSSAPDPLAAVPAASPRIKDADTNYQS
jgi:hypothetical protein